MIKIQGNKLERMMKIQSNYKFLPLSVSSQTTFDTVIYEDTDNGIFALKTAEKPSPQSSYRLIMRQLRLGMGR